MTLKTEAEVLKLMKHKSEKSVNMMPVTETDGQGTVYLLGFVQEVTNRKPAYFEKPKKFPDYLALKNYLEELEEAEKAKK